MIVCVNPGADDYDETRSVMRFAKMAQDVKISKMPSSVRSNPDVNEEPTSPITLTADSTELLD